MDGKIRATSTVTPVRPLGPSAGPAMAAAESHPPTRGRTALQVGAGILVLALAAVAAVAASGAELYSVVARGHDLLPYPSSEVAEVRLAGSVTVYIETEPVSMPDALNGAMLVSAGSLALAAWWVLLRLGAPAVTLRFFGLLGLGVGFLGVDELLGGHETLGHNLRFLGQLPGVDHPDDVIISLYALPAFAFAFFFRDLILSSRAASVLLGGVLLLYVVAAAADHTQWSIEEEAEALAGALTLAAVLVLSLAAFGRRLEPDD